MLSFLVMLCALGQLTQAMAADPSPGALLPGAGVVPSEQGGIAVGGFGGVMMDFGGGAFFGGPAAGGWFAPAPGWLFEGAIAAGSTLGTDRMAGVRGAVRTNIVESDPFRFGVFAGAGSAGGPDVHGMYGYATGVALETGQRVRFDLTWPVYVNDASEGEPEDPSRRYKTLPLFLSEFGVTFPVRSGKEFRIGKDATGLGVAWRKQKDDKVIETRISTLVFIMSASVRVSWG